MDLALGGNGIQASIDVHAAIEGAGEVLGTRVVHGGDVSVRRQVGAVVLGSRLVDEVLLESRLGIPDLFGLGGEHARNNIGLLDQRLEVLDLGVSFRLELTGGTHGLKSLVLVGADRVLQSELTLAKVRIQRNVAHLERVSTRLDRLPAVAVLRVAGLEVRVVTHVPAFVFLHFHLNYN